MTEIMPVPRNLNFTVLPAGGLGRALFLLWNGKIRFIPENPNAPAGF